MNFNHFIHLVPVIERANATRRTLEIWHQIFYHILGNSEADTADDEAFVEKFQKSHRIGVKTLTKHLTRMAAAGILQAHPMRRKADEGTLILQKMIGSSAPTLPTAFLRYTLPGKEPSRRLRKGERLWAELRRNMRDPSVKKLATEMGFAESDLASMFNLVPGR